MQTVNEATTLGWGTRVKGFIACFVVGVGCTILVRSGTVAVMANLLEEETHTADVALRVLLALRNVMLSHCGDPPVVLFECQLWF